MSDTEKPWVLLRRRRLPTRFASRDEACRFYDGLRCNSAGAQEAAALFGPDGAAWYCQRWRWAQWERDDDRRRREPPDHLPAPEAAPYWRRREWRRLGNRLAKTEKPGHARAIAAEIAALFAEEDASGAFARESAEAMQAGLPCRVRSLPPPADGRLGDRTSDLDHGLVPDVAAAPFRAAADDPDVAGNVSGQHRYCRAGGGWREARARLRAEGREVKQFDGILYIDGVRSTDPALLPPAG